VRGPRVDSSGVIINDGPNADSVWEYYLPPYELVHYNAEVARCANRLLRIPPAARKRLPSVGWALLYRPAVAVQVVEEDERVPSAALSGDPGIALEVLDLTDVDTAFHEFGTCRLDV